MGSSGWRAIPQAVRSSLHVEPAAWASAAGPAAPADPFSGEVRGISISPDGRHAYGVLGNGVVVGFARQRTTGALRTIGEQRTCHLARRRCDLDAFPEGLVLSPDGRNAYYGIENRVAVLRRRAATGALAPLPGLWGCIGDEDEAGCRLARGVGLVNAVAISPDGRNVYVGSFGEPLIATFARGRDGRLVQLTGPQGCLTGPGPVVDLPHGPRRCGRAQIDSVEGLGLSPDGQNLYALGLGRGGWLRVFSRRLTP